MPLTDRSQAKESGFAQVREAMQKFVGTVDSAEFGQWGGALIDEGGKPIPPKEFLEIICSNVEVLEVSEELVMSVEEWNFRVNCSEFKGSFWVDKFLESADRAKILIPDDLVGKRITWEKASMSFTIKERDITQTNFVIAKVEAAPKSKPTVVTKAPAEEVPVEEGEGTVHSMDAALELAVGKTEAQFRTAVALDPQFSGSPLLPLAKAGAITQALITEGKLVIVKEGNKQVYQKPS